MVEGVSPCGCQADNLLWGKYLDISPINGTFVAAFTGIDDEGCLNWITDGISGFSFQRYIDNTCSTPTGDPLDFTLFISVQCCTDEFGVATLSVSAHQDASSEGIAFGGGGSPSNGMIIANTVSVVIFGCGGTMTITWA